MSIDNNLESMATSFARIAASLEKIAVNGIFSPDAGVAMSCAHEIEKVHKADPDSVIGKAQAAALERAFPAYNDQETRAKIAPVEDTPDPEPAEISFQDTKDAIKNVGVTAGRDAALGILKQFQAKTISAVKAEDYPAFMRACAEAK